jgi:hypothetical protein
MPAPVLVLLLLVVVLQVSDSGSIERVSSYASTLCVHSSVLPCTVLRSQSSRGQASVRWSKRTDV